MSDVLQYLNKVELLSSVQLSLTNGTSEAMDVIHFVDRPSYEVLGTETGVAGCTASAKASRRIADSNTNQAPRYCFN